MKRLAFFLLLAFACKRDAPSGVASTAAPPPAPTPTPSPSPTPAPPPPTPVTTLAGEVHVHQWSNAQHVWATFIDPPIAIGDLQGQSVTEIDPPIAALSGPCELLVLPTCASVCAEGSYCVADGKCAKIPERTYVDGGDVEITGGTISPRVALTFDPTSLTYTSSPPPGPTLIFAAGDQMRIADASSKLGFDAQVPAPAQLALVSPLTLVTLPPAPFDVKWAAAGGDEVDVQLWVSGAGGKTAFVRCATSDTGELSIAQELVSALPPPPREMRLDVTRSEQRIVAMRTSGVGVLLHVATSAWATGRE